MQRRINLLSTILVIAILFGGISFCTSPSSLDAAKQGRDRAFEEWEEKLGGSPAYENGYQKGREVQEKIPVSHKTVRLHPKYGSEFNEEIINQKTGAPIRSSLRDISIQIDDQANKWGWIDTILCIVILLALLLFIWSLFSFIAEVKGGEIFVRGNEVKLRWMGVFFLFWYISDWISSIMDYSFIKSNVAFEGYKIVYEHPAALPLVLGIVFFLFAEIFALGRKMKEDQEYMV